MSESNTVQSAPSQQPKKKFLRRATFLHAGSLMVMLGVFVLLSVQLANRSLEQLLPTGGTVTLFQQTAEPEKSYPLNAGQSLLIAKIIDSAEYENLVNTQKIGKITLKLTNGPMETFDLTVDGIIAHRGWYTQRKLNSDEIKRIIEIAVSQK